MFNHHFSKRTIKALTRKGIAIIGLQASGNVYDPETLYIVNDNGTQRIWTFNQVLEMGK